MGLVKVIYQFVSTTLQKKISAKIKNNKAKKKFQPQEHSTYKKEQQIRGNLGLH